MTGKTNSANKKIELEEITVNPGVSDAIKSAEDGKGFSKVTVPGDADLIAANIREGVDIFGVLGAMKEGVDLTSLFGYTKYSIDSFTPSSYVYNSNTFNANHSLGEKPKMAIAISNADTYSYTYELILFVGYALNDTDSSDYANAVYFKASGSNSDRLSAYHQIGFRRTNANIGFYCDNYSLKAGVEYTLITMA